MLKEKYQFYIIEDAACSLGTEYKDMKVGTQADISVFSLHPRKFITTGEGRLITTNNEAWAEWMRSYKHFGMGSGDTRSLVRFERIGSNHKLSDVLTAIGLDLYRERKTSSSLQYATSATYKKERSKRYDTPVGSFLYQDVPAGVYPHGVMFAGEGEHRFLIASAEKALCDELYLTSGVRSLGRLEHLLFEDLRLDLPAFNQLDHGALMLLAVHYKTATLATLVKFVRKKINA